MKKYTDLNEVKIMTKREFTKLLTSDGLIVLNYPGEYRLMIPCTDEKTFQYVCQLHGASGNYFPERKLGIISNWGCNDSLYEFQPDPENLSREEILKEIQQTYETTIQKCGNMEIVKIHNIPEKKFRKLLVKYDCYCVTYKEKIRKGILIL